MSDKCEKTGIELEFEDIDSKNLWVAVYNRIKTVSNAYDYTLDDAKKSENRTLNRYRDVIPYDHSRITLQRCSNDYINANLVEIEQANRKYILTQGPLENTIAHFWVMVWEQNCKAIVMLNKIIEKNQLKCSQYWPASSSSDLDLPDVNLSVHLDSEVNHSYFVTRHLRVTDKSSQEAPRNVILFHYTTWPDFGVPQSPTALLRFMRAVRQSGALDESSGPPIVHCSAGIGRSGTFILVDCCLKLISDQKVDKVSVQEILLEMRHYRMGLIQTPDQLRFSYQAIIQGIRTDWEAEDDNSLPATPTSELAPLKSTNGLIDSASSSDEEPPTIPPRGASRGPPPDKPLPTPPTTPDDELPPLPPRKDVPDSDSDQGNSNSDDNSVRNRRKRKAEPLPSSPPSSPSDEMSPQNGFGNGGGGDARKRKTEEKAASIAEKVKLMQKKQTDAEDKKKRNGERWAFALRVLTHPYSLMGLVALGGGLYYYALAWAAQGGHARPAGPASGL
uniref:protein-tyrosine-phosphatase n=2 Tax=Cacopsylla melanoneura TaxID=428564 RepID=A0A8D9AQD1_9HEMI